MYDNLDSQVDGVAKLYEQMNKKNQQKFIDLMQAFADFNLHMMALDDEEKKYLDGLPTDATEEQKQLILQRRQIYQDLYGTSISLVKELMQDPFSKKEEIKLLADAMNSITKFDLNTNPETFQQNVNNLNEVGDRVDRYSQSLKSNASRARLWAGLKIGMGAFLMVASIVLAGVLVGSLGVAAPVVLPLALAAAVGGMALMYKGVIDLENKDTQKAEQNKIPKFFEKALNHFKPTKEKVEPVKESLDSGVEGSKPKK